MPVENINTVRRVVLDKELEEQIEKANQIHVKHFGDEASFGRCIFLSWYCSLGNCDFCYRSTQKELIPDPALGRRRPESIYTEALLAKALGWKLEFLTGGYGILPFEDTRIITANMRKIFGERIWLNIGVLGKRQMESALEDIEGVVASVESLTPHIRQKACPGKPLAPFEHMLMNAKALGLKRSITIILGLGETFEEYHYVHDFIKKHSLDRITFYSLRPVKGTPYERGPDPEYVLRWISRTRIDFPKIEISYGSAETRLMEIPYVLRAGVNILTKLPATRLFGTEGGLLVEEKFKEGGRIFKGEFVDYPDVKWSSYLEGLDMTNERKEKILKKIKNYEVNRMKKAYKDFKLVKEVCEPCKTGI